MKRRASKPLKADIAAQDAQDVPRAPGRPLKFLIGLGFLPAVWILAQTFFSILSRETIERDFWKSPEFLWFAVVADLWVVLFIFKPNLMRKLLTVYVFGHELTHALWAWLLGGRIKNFRATRSGGYVVTNRDDVLVVLAPYFYPVYSMIVVLEYGIFGWLVDVRPFHPIFFALLGLTWSFHITFTFWMIRIGQPDIVYHGTFFSLLFILFMNLLVMSALLCVASPGVSLVSFGTDLWENTVGWCSWAGHLIAGFAR
jgi:hypothetical protein